MGHIIGIDLGTCNSAMVVPEKRTGAGFYHLEGYDGYSVIVDRFHRRITPSVVALADGGNVIVGHSAKARAGFSPAPIFFAKRFMGEAKTFSLGNLELTPVDVSAHVLRHLKKEAEDQLGGPVDTAVITVPAYFSIAAKQRTEEAALKAGLKVAQILPEPVAAALMYCAKDPRDPLLVMTYDLGGGTFDVAILEKKQGQIAIDSIRASDGDRFVGGSDFDTALAWWMVDQLTQKGYDLKLDVQKPEDQAIFARLLVFAERAKIELSKNTVCEINEPSSGLTDHSGNPVSIDLTISRDEFERMISRRIEDTIEICRRAFSRTEPLVTYDKLDEVLMVGGSSRIPYVARRLRDEFGREPRLVEPDLCVAMGAGIVAAAFRRTSIGGVLELDTLPPATSLTQFVVSGRVQPPAPQAALSCRVKVMSADGGYAREVVPKEDGRFLVDRVPLSTVGDNEFVLRVFDAAGNELANHRFTVSRSATGTGGPGAPAGAKPAPTLVQRGTRTNFLAKPIVVVWRSGPEIIAPFRTPLPFKTSVVSKTTDLSGRIRIQIREDNTPLGEILMDDIPKTLPVGSEVEIELAIRENYQVEARAYVKALAKESTVRISIPPRPIRNPAELQRDCSQLAARVDDAIRSAGPGARFGNRKIVRLQERVAACQEMLAGRSPDAPAIEDCLDEIEALLREITAVWTPDPTREVFDKLVREAWDVHKDLTTRKPESASHGYDARIEATVKEAESAYAAQHAARWKQGFERLREVVSEMSRQIAPEQKLPPPPMLKMLLAKDLKQLEEKAKSSGKLAALRTEFADAAAKLNAIDTQGNPDDATSKLVQWYLQEFQELERAVTGMSAEDGTLDRFRPS